jgi:hypothetical protein
VTRWFLGGTPRVIKVSHQMADSGGATAWDEQSEKQQRPQQLGKNDDSEAAGGLAGKGYNFGAPVSHRHRSA